MARKTFDEIFGEVLQERDDSYAHYQLLPPVTAADAGVPLSPTYYALVQEILAIELRYIRPIVARILTLPLDLICRLLPAVFAISLFAMAVKSPSQRNSLGIIATMVVGVLVVCLRDPLFAVWRVVDWSVISLLYWALFEIQSAKAPLQRLAMLVGWLLACMGQYQVFSVLKYSEILVFINNVFFGLRLQCCYLVSSSFQSCVDHLEEFEQHDWPWITLLLCIGIAIQGSQYKVQVP